MPTCKLTIAYDGAGFRGWATQPDQRTVQGEVEAALRKVFSGAEIRLTVAGRTDTGVHALAQVASFTTESELPEDLAWRLSSILPGDVAVLSAEPAPDGFDARRWARSRGYEYRISTVSFEDPFERGRALWWPHPLDRDALNACAKAIVGEHDFTAFTPTQTEHVRFTRHVLRAGWVEERPDILVFVIEADAFMRNMIRVLVGTMLEVGRGRRSIGDLAALLNGAPRKAAGETAPAHALYFTGATFGDGPLEIPESD